MKRLFLIFGLLLYCFPAFAQQSVKVCVPTPGVNNCIPVTSSNPLPVNATVSASISGFAPASTGTPIAVTTGGNTGTLPVGTVVVVSNVGSTNGAFCKLGAAATTSDQLIPPNGWFAFTVGVATQLTCITSTSTTTINMVGGTGLATGAGGGAAGGGGGGGAVTIADGADVTQGALADAACATDNGACTEQSLIKRANQRLTVLNTTLGSPFQAGGSIGNTSFIATQATASNFNATVIGTGTFAVQATQSGTWNITNISGTVSLPTGASTAAKQPALGTAGSASTDVLTVQGIASMTALKVDGSAVTQPVSVATLPLPALAATSTKQSDGTQKSQIVDGSGNVIASTSNNLNVQCANCSGSGVSAVDKATFTAGTSVFAPSGGFFQTTATSNPLTNGQQGAWQLTATRAGFVNLRDASGTELGVAAAPLQVSLANTASNGTSLNVICTSGCSGGATFGAGFPGTGTAVGFSDGTNLVTARVGDVNNVAAATNYLNTLTVARYNATQPTLTDTRYNAFQVSSRGELLVAPGTSGFAVSATQSGTWNVTNISGTVSLPTGASTSAKQPALGTAGSASADVITVQGIASMTALKVDGSAVTQPISGSVTVSGTVTANAGTNLNTSLLALESGGNIATLVTDIGAPGATACATDTASCNQNQQLQRLAQRLTTINTTLASPFQAGGSIGNTTFAATQATAASLNATVVGTGTFAVQATLPTTPTIAAGNGMVSAVSSESSAGSSLTVTSAIAANLVVKASAGNLYGLQVSADSTLSAAAWWIIIYNATSAPADGAITPSKCFAMPLGATSFSASWDIPVQFSTGITVGVSTTGCFTKTASTHAFISGDFK